MLRYSELLYSTFWIWIAFLLLLAAYVILRRRLIPIPKNREFVLSMCWVGITGLLLLAAYLITAKVAHVEDWDPGNGYSIGFYRSEAAAQALPKEATPVELIIWKGDGVVELKFRGTWTGPSTQRVVFQQLKPYPKCEWVNGFGVSGLERIPLKAQPVEGGYEDEWSYFEIPSDDGGRVVECQVEDLVHEPRFRERDLFISNEDTVGRLSGFVATPIKVEMSYYETMTASHFFINGDGRQIDSRSYMFQPKNFGVFEWTSARQTGDEISLLVIVGALVAVAATTFIEAIRFWFSMLIGRLFPTADDS